MDRLAVLEATLRAHFPEEVSLAALSLDAAVPPLLPDEAPYAERAVPRRQQELAVGRYLARRLLFERGVPWGPLLRREDRTVVWPEGFVGSISHTKDICVAAVARADEVPCLGVDIEASTVSAAIQPKILRPEEQAELSHLPPPELARRATGVFSAKEAFYKAQYPTTETFLGFMDVRLTHEAEPQRVTVRVVRPGSPLLGLQLSGFLVEVDAWVASGFFGACQTVDVDR
ncbi:MAG: 4'-phosphopantetheinyl transferase superfamily protein [Myxococcales bacterium]|nr:4'-phosphopantetheinyl transferase superfamily protein [Myxococcales bacterium]